MSFSSADFLLLFLPVALAGLFLLGRLAGRRVAMGWLVLTTLVFYAWYTPAFLPVLAGSALFNFAIGLALLRRRRRALLLVGLVGNVGALVFFKYADAATVAGAALVGLEIAPAGILLPLGMSFFTFQQISFIVDTYEGGDGERSFLRYALFVCFFPYLVSGPITRHREIAPQYDAPEAFRPRLDDIAVGLTIFVIGLTKKVMLADFLAPFADELFATAADGPVPTAKAWLGVLSYALQLYFDFSGYTDMAIGIGRMMGLKLPQNFDSPYKAPSIIEFWSRWHMTLTRFLTGYIYNPLAMALTRRRIAAGKPILRRGTGGPETFLVLVAGPTMLTMAIAGIWHGAGWQFLVFGLLHGVYLSVNHGWRMLRKRRPLAERWAAAARPLGVVLTLACVVVAQVFFRADSVSQALVVLAGMTGVDAAPAVDLPGTTVMFVVLGFAIVWLMPNTEQIMRAGDIGLKAAEAGAAQIRAAASPRDRVAARVMRLLQWQPSVVRGLAAGAVLCLVLLQALARGATEFVYFSF